MGGHAPLPPSGVSRWSACTASVALTASAEKLGLKTAEPSEHAREGTVAMAILERMLPGPDGEPGASFEDAFMLACAERVIDITEVRADMKGALEFAARHLHPFIVSASWHGVEVPVDIPQVPTRGTADFVAVKTTSGAESIVVADYKHGVGIEVDPVRNGQLMLYAAGVASMHGLNRLDIPVTLIVIQPRHAAGGFRPWTTTLGDVFAFATEMGERSRRFTYKTGDHCRFCAGAPICGLRLAELRLLDQKAEDFDPGKDKTGEILAEIMRLAPRVKKLIDVAKGAAIARLVSGFSVPGFGLKEGPGSQVWKHDALRALVEQYGEKAFSKELLSPAQVRDTLPGGKEFVARYAFRRPGNPNLELKG